MGTWTKLAYYTDITGTNLANLSGVATEFLNGLGAFTVPAGLYPPVYKTTTETVKNSTVLQNDDELKQAALANEVWGILFVLRIYGYAAAADFKFAVTVPTGAVVRIGLTAEAAGAASATDQYVTGSGSVVTVDNAADESKIVLLHCSVAMGANPGDIQLQWAQNVANDSNTQVLSGSYLIPFKLA